MIDAKDSQPIEELSPGQMLSKGRQQAGLTQEQVAKQLYMTVYKVNALEADDYKRLNSDTFVRGYIRAYANLVKVDVVVILAAYDRLIDEITPVTVSQQAAAASEQGNRGAWQFLAVIGAFFVGLWLISVWFFDNHTESEYVVAAESVSSVAPSTPSPQRTPLSTADSMADQNEQYRSIASSQQVSAKSDTLVSNNSSVVASVSSVAFSIELNASAGTSAVPSANAPSSNAQSSSASSKNTSLDELSLSFRGESWLEVSDSRGDVLATELEPAGKKIRLVGVAPFDVKLGNAPVVDIQLNGKKIDVIPLMGSNVLILKIGN